MEESHITDIFPTSKSYMEGKKDTRATSVAISPDNKMIAVGSVDGILKLFDMKTRKLIHSFEDPNPFYDAIKALVFTSDSKYIVAGSWGRAIAKFDIEGKTQVNRFAQPDTQRVCDLVISPDNRFVIIGFEVHEIKILDLMTFELYHHFKSIHAGQVRSVCVTPDSRFIISGSADRSMKIFDIQNKTQVYHFKEAHSRWIKSIALSSDGKFIVSCSDDRSIKIFDFNNKQLVHCFKNAHDDFIEKVKISQDCRFIVSASKDKSIKIFDLRTKQQIHHFKNAHEACVKAIAITSNNKYIVSASYDGSVKIFKLTPYLHSSSNQIYQLYNGLSNYCDLNAVDDFLNDTTLPLETVNATTINCQQLTIYPYLWNILHLVSIKGQYNFIRNMPGYSQFKVPFLLDAFSKTPLHYLLAQEKINFASVNTMLSYISDYLEDILSKGLNYQAQQILISLTPLFWFILIKTDIRIRNRFLNICFITPPLPHGTELPAFGKPVTNIDSFHPTLESACESINTTWKEGQDQLDFRASLLNLDYSVTSSDMTKTVKCLLRQKNEEIFKAPFVSKLIDHLWDQSKLFLQINVLLFSAYIIALSVYLSLQERCLPFEIVVLCCSGAFLFAEGVQAANLKKDFLKDPWNWLDIAFHPLTIAFVITRMLESQNELARAWISTIIIIIGYFRWISYLRVFKPTRNLIQVIITVVNDMKSFITILALIIIGFAFIFLVFNRGRLYGFYLYSAYGSLYGPIDDGEMSASEKLLIAFIAFLLNVILLNLLISIMGDSYAKVLEKRIKTDALTRLDMISDAANLLKFLRRKGSLKRGFLVFCLSLDSVDDEDEEDNDAEGRLNMLVKKNEEFTEKGMNKLEQEISSRFEKLEQKMKANIDERFKAYDEKTNTMLALMVEMKEKLDKMK